MMVFKFFRFYFFVFAVLLFSTTMVHGYDENPFSLLVSPSGLGSNYLKVTGFLPDDYEAGYFALHIKGYKDGQLLEQRSIPLRSMPVFHVGVTANRNYEFVMDAYDRHQAFIIESERLYDISGARFLNRNTVYYAEPSKKAPRSMKVLSNGLEITIANITSPQFPHVNATIGIRRDGQTVDNLTEQNFSLLEDGLAPASGITVVPPATSGGVRQVDFAVVFDHSGSMNDKLSDLRDAIGDFTDALQSSNIDFNLAFVPYERNPRIEQDFTPSASTFLGSVDNFLNNWPSGGIENAFLALETANNSLTWRSGSQRVIILVTDEDDDHGGPTLEEINQILTNSQTVVYPVIRYTYGNANQIFCKAGSVADVTGGNCYDIYTPDFINILDDIQDIYTQTYIIKYTTGNHDTASGDRQVSVTVSDDGDQATDSKFYNPAHSNRIDINLSHATRELSGNAQRHERALTIEAKVNSLVVMQEVDLFYRNIQGGYQRVPMSDNGSGLYAADIPSHGVQDPKVEYYVQATDGISTNTYPENNASENPVVISVLPNIAPNILHLQLFSAKSGEDYSIHALIGDETNQVDYVTLHYRTKGDNRYQKQEFLVNQKLYGLNTVIPAQYVKPPGVEYYITATDDYGAVGYYQNAKNPHSVVVSGAYVPENSTVVGDLEIWYQKEKNQNGDTIVSGYVKIGPKGTPLLSVNGAVKIESDNKITSQGEVMVSAYQVRRNSKKDPEDIPLFQGHFSGSGDDATITPAQSAKSELRLIRSFLLPLTHEAKVQLNGKGTVSPDTIDLQGWGFNFNKFHLFVKLNPITLDKSGKDTTGSITLNTQDFQNVSKLAVTGGIGINDFEFELDFIRQSIELQGAIQLQQGYIFPIDQVTASFDLLLSPELYLDGFSLGGKFAGPKIENPYVFTLPQTPPSTIGIAPSSFKLGAGNFSAGYQNLEITGSLSGALADTALINQTMKAVSTYWPLVGTYYWSVDLSGKATLGGNAVMMQHWDVGNVKLVLFKRNGVFAAEFTGDITLLNEAIDIFIGELALMGHFEGNNFSFKGHSLMKVQVPSTRWSPSVNLYSTKVNGKIIGKTGFNWPTTAQFSTSYSILWKDLTLRIDLVQWDWGISAQSMSAGDGYTKVRMTGDDLYSSQQYSSSKLQSIGVSRSVTVPSEEDVVTIMILSDKDAALFNLTTPGGTTYNPQDNPPDPNSPNADKVFFMSNPDANSGYWALKEPEGGQYQLFIANENDLGNFEIQVLTQNAMPEITINQPVSPIRVNQGDTVTIAWDAKDPDDDAEISLYYDFDGQDLNGALIVDGISEEHGPDYYKWTLPENLYGDIYIYAEIDDGNLGPNYAYAPGYFQIQGPQPPTVPQNIQLVKGDGSVQATWDDNDSSEEVSLYRVYMENNGSIYEYLTGTTRFELDNLANVENYSLAVTAIDENNVESEKSNWYHFSPIGTSIDDGPPDLRFGEITYQFIEDDKILFEVPVHNDADYPAYTYDVGCWYGGKDPNRLVDMQAKSLLPPGETEILEFTLSLSQLVNLCDARSVFFEIKNVVLEELNTDNNQHVVSVNIPGLRKVSLSVSAGWNLISLPVSPGNRKIENVLGGLSYNTVWAYNNGKWAVHDPRKSYFSDLDTMDAGDGYWINADESLIIEVCGWEVADEIHLNAGWNLVGFNSESPIDVTDALSSIDRKYFSVWSFIDGSWKYYSPAHSGHSNLKEMKPGSGIWIHATEACTWALP